MSRFWKALPDGAKRLVAAPLWVPFWVLGHLIAWVRGEKYEPPDFG